MLKTAFIVGSNRSGTTILGKILDNHPQIGYWYEPFFIYDKYFRDRNTDRRLSSDATDQVKEYIRGEFAYWQQKTGCEIVLDKNPFNSMKVGFILEIFPDAKFVHVIRDGRDVTLSLNKEWQERVEILRSQRNFFRALRAFWNSNRQQRLWKHRYDHLMFEIGDLRNLSKGYLQMSHRVRRWKGRLGYGPIFDGWEEFYDTHTPLEFNAMQWRQCVECVLEDQPLVPPEQFLEIRYETFIAEPRLIFEQIFDFLEIAYPADFDHRMPGIMEQNAGKWKTAFSVEEITALAPIVQPLLLQLGYEKNDDWYRVLAPTRENKGD